MTSSLKARVAALEGEREVHATDALAGLIRAALRDDLAATVKALGRVQSWPLSPSLIQRAKQYAERIRADLAETDARTCGAERPRGKDGYS